MNVMDLSLNYWNISKCRPKYLESVPFKVTALPPWFWALLNKALEEVLNSQHVFVGLAIPRFFCSKCRVKYLRKNVATLIRHVNKGKEEIISFVIETYGKPIDFNFDTQI